MSPDIAPITSFIPLSAQASLRAQPDACLTLRFRDLHCSECADICPTRTLTIADDGFSLGADCVECGRCVAVCPTGALSSGFEPPDLAGEGEAPVRVECFKVPEALCGDRTLRVPCTGALSTAQWLRLIRGAGPEGLTLVDRGWCLHCKAGGDAHPATRQIDTATQLLREAGHRHGRVEIEGATLPPGSMPAGIPFPNREPALGRRGFLRALVGHAARAIDPQAAPEQIGVCALPNGNRRILPTARLAVLACLRELSEVEAAAIPVSLFHDVSVDGDCCNHQVCARSCPTTALRVYEDGEVTGLRFDPVLCIGCGLCESGCPQQALSLSRAAAGSSTEHRAPASPVQVTTIQLERARTSAVQAGTRPLTAHNRRHCFDCGSAFVPVCADVDAERCPACVKSQELGQSLFADLFQR